MFQSRLRSEESVSRLVRSSSPSRRFVVDAHAEPEVYVAPRKGNEAKSVVNSDPHLFSAAIRTTRHQVPLVLGQQQVAHQPESLRQPVDRSVCAPITLLKSERIEAGLKVEELEDRMRQLFRLQTAALAEDSAPQFELIAPITRYELTESATHRATRDALRRAEKIELAADETRLRDHIEHDEDETFTAMARCAKEHFARIRDAEAASEQLRVATIQKQLAAHETLIARGSIHRTGLQDTMMTSTAGFANTVRDNRANSFLALAYADVSQRIATSSSKATDRTSLDNRTVRFVMTHEQERAAEDTQRQIEEVLNQTQRRKNKRDLMQRLLSMPLLESA